MQVKNLDSKNETGYKKFLSKAQEIFDILGKCDSNIKALLLKAQQLYNTQEINEFINNCNYN
jgi:hypothetical protein